MAAIYAETNSNPAPAASLSKNISFERLSEGVWFLVCLSLFMILGPFSAPVALIFLFSRQVLDNEMAEPESLPQC